MKMEKITVGLMTPCMICSVDLLNKFERNLDIKDCTIPHKPFDGANYLAQEKVVHLHVEGLMSIWEQHL